MGLALLGRHRLDVHRLHQDLRLLWHRGGFIFCARKENRKKTAAVLVPLAFTASLASITEPLDFMFCFSAPILWVAHACISGLFIVLLHIFHVTGFTTNLLGSVLMTFLPVQIRPTIPPCTCWRCARSQCTLWCSPC